VRFVATKTVRDFMQSDAFLTLLMGPRGEGKTTGGLFKPIYRAKQTNPQFLPIRMAVIRDTWANLQRTVMETIREQEQEGLEIQWAEGKTEAIVGGGLVHFYFMGMDNPKDINKLQGFGIGALWIEEPAPAADISGGVAAEVLGVGATSLRQKGVEPWIQITMNPPDEDHWTMEIMEKLKELAQELRVGELKAESFRIPKGENPHISWEKRERDKALLYAIGRGDLVSRLVEGKVGQIILGEQLMPEYNDDWHTAKKPLPIIRGVEIVRTWDGGLNPTCIWSQPTKLGHWHILGAVRGENIGLEQLITTQVLPWESQYLGDREEWQFRDIVDPAMATREQSNSQRSAVKTMIDLLNASPEAGAIEWRERRDSLKAVLSRNIRGKPLFVVDPDCKIVRKALRGGAHYPKDALGRVTPTLEAYKRASGLHSHPVDAIMLGAAKLYPLPDLLRPPKKVKKVAKKVGGPLAWMGA